MAAGKQGRDPADDFGFTPEQLEKFLGLVDAVQKAQGDGNGAAGGGQPAPPPPSVDELLQEGAARSYEAISNRLGRLSPQRQAINAQWTQKTLKFDGAGLAQGQEVELVRSDGKRERLNLRGDLSVRPSVIASSDDVAGVVIRDPETSIVLGIVGPIAPFGA